MRVLQKDWSRAAEDLRPNLGALGTECDREGRRGRVEGFLPGDGGRQAGLAGEIAKEKERLKSDKERTRKMRSKKTIDEELEEDTKVEEPEEEYLQYYFNR